MNRRVIILLSLASVAVAGAAQANADAVKIGANAGAMKYCRDQADGADTGKYAILAKRTSEEFESLDLKRGEKVKALAARKKAEDGDYLGDKLTKDRCDRLRRTLTVRYK